ncbi:hypothetical protein GOP47_0014785 [Adiantum capillus-veneris]|uniref:Glycosyltransferase family 92 protein n=1 Tax=Adiantum capillus-veneris TaxID=13818 RepID=A0A9D4UMN2_ADICA|nr:hypothetical protein GOP47_0014785 [Adiantum capillus-veneris]
MISCTGTVRLLAFFMALFLLGLASRVPVEVNKIVSPKLQSGMYFPAANINAARTHEERIPADASWSVMPTLSSALCIQDVVLLPDDILLIIPLPERRDGKPSLLLPPKQHLTCLFDNTITTSLAGLDYSRGRALVRCRRPETNITSTISIAGDEKHIRSPHYSGELARQYGLNHVSLMIHGLRDVAASLVAPVHVKKWQYLVFELWATETDVVLFAKGINRRQGHNVRPDKLICVFGIEDDDVVDAEVVETKVLASAQEVFRCAHPPPAHRRRLIGKPVTLRWGTKVLPTVAYYEEIPVVTEPPSQEICACTMIFNVAKFLPEWSTFHSHVGLDRFILYDNNSEDELDEALQWLGDRRLQVIRYPWPWPKTQEAGFSHCILLAAWQSCQWVMFADVDEFVFPAAFLPPSGRATPLRQLIAEAENRPRHGNTPHRQADTIQINGLSTVAEQSTPPAVQSRPGQDTAVPGHLQRRPSSVGQAGDSFAPPGMQGKGRPIVGQISLKCRDFGPSNLTRHPTRGVTQGYVCRSRKELRHKSLVRLTAVSHDLQNVIHHFNLLPEYMTLTEHPDRAVVNHYKYQAWPEFRQKFRRRVSAYVADWKEQRNLESRDRTPGLGARDHKPANWETAFCKVSDTALRDYCNTIFAVNSSGDTSTLTWQLS